MWRFDFHTSICQVPAVWLCKMEESEEEAGAVEIAHTVSVKFNDGKFIQIPDSLLVKEKG